MRRLLAVLVAGLPLLAPLLAVPTAASAAAEEPERWATEVFARVPSPGYPAYVHKHTNGRVYAGTYVNSQATGVPSRVFEWTGDGTLLRSWPMPGQVRDGEHGVQVAHQTRSGRLVLLETSKPRVLTLDVRTGRFRTLARFPDGAVPNYATWGPGGALYVTDYAAGVIWRVGRDREPERWFTSPALEGVLGLGTTGIGFRRGSRDLLITQQTTTATPTRGHLSSLPVNADGSPGELRTLWTSAPGDLPDGFGIGRSGRIYVAMAGLSAQLVELSADGEELGRFPETPLTGDNGSPIPFDTACSATFHGTRVLVANQSAVLGDASHQAILAVEVGERGRAAYLPRPAWVR
ncbi:SMP-30/gluconolactonase/LRE family protein [Nocardioides ferulae]|uniref:SMP-30/gluconolactonase/LRE family protein n=1 Tax=Nocardioides ferulae TaxID=2340821 RepID=UPI000EADFF81|nr:hypothetical protein [Nocardioides ferulae]